jgi:general secretion pathway protein A
MHSDFYGFTGQPFQQTTEPAHCFQSLGFQSLGHNRALTCVIKGLAQGEGFVVLTGEAGVGKTTLIAQLLATIDPAQVTIAHMEIGHPAAGQPADGERVTGQTIPAVARAFGLAVAPILGLAAETRNPFMLDANLGFLRDEARAGRRCLLVVDEAQALSIAALEALRLMSIFQLGDRPLLQILLVGGPEFRTRLHDHPDLEQLRQRVVASHHLDPLEASEVERYIHHRLTRVGWDGNPTFDPLVHADLHNATGGVPKQVNRIVERLLLLGAVRQQAHIDTAMLSLVLADLAAEAIAKFGGEDGDHAVAGPGLKTRLEAALARCEGQIGELQRAVSGLVDPGNASADTQQRLDSAALQERLGNLESRMIEQERTIRHTLTMLIDWIERDEAHSCAA